jgi:hypothetical protein
MSKGYSTLVVREIEDANPLLLGVQLGKICVKHSISVKDVAEFFAVSRVTVYGWFKGKVVMSGSHVEKAQKLIAKLA